MNEKLLSPELVAHLRDLLESAQEAFEQGDADLALSLFRQIQKEIGGIDDVSLMTKGIFQSYQMVDYAQLREFFISNQGQMNQEAPASHDGNQDGGEQEDEVPLGYHEFRKLLADLILSDPRSQDDRAAIAKEYGRLRELFVAQDTADFPVDQHAAIIGLFKDLKIKIDAFPESDLYVPNSAIQLEQFVSENLGKLHAISEILRLKIYDPQDDFEQVDGALVEIKYKFNRRLQELEDDLKAYKAAHQDVATSIARRRFVEEVEKKYLNSEEVVLFRDLINAIENSLWFARLSVDYPILSELQEFVAQGIELNDGAPLASLVAGRNKISKISQDLARAEKVLDEVKSYPTREKHVRGLIDNTQEMVSLEEQKMYEFWTKHIQTLYDQFSDVNPDSFVSYLNRLEAQISASTQQDADNLVGEFRNALNVARSQYLSSKGRVAPNDNSSFQNDYNIYMESYWNRAAQIISKLESLSGQFSNRESQVNKANRIREDLNNLSSKRLEVNPLHDADDMVERNYAPLYQRFQELRESELLSDEELKSLESEILAGEYKHRRTALFHRMGVLEAQNYGSDLGTIFSGIENKLIARMKVVVSRLEELGKLNGYQADVEQVDKDYLNRKLAHLSWIKVWEHILGSGTRDLPQSVTTDSFPIGAIMDDYIKNGVETGEFGEGTNPVLGERRVRIRDFEDVSATREIVVNETAMGYVFRQLDRIYSGEDPDAKTTSGVSITPSNLQDYSEELVDYLTLKEQMRPGGPRFDRNLVLRAFRAHMMITLNHSYLPPRNLRAKIPDRIYYRFHIFEYALDYDLQGVAEFVPLVSYMLFAITDENGKEKVNPLQGLYSGGMFGEGYDKMVRAMEEGGYFKPNPELKEKWGISHFRFLMEPLITLTNVAQGSLPDPDENGNPVPRVCLPTMNSPLSYYVVQEQHLANFVDVSGNPLLNNPRSDTPLRYKVRGGDQGRFVKVDDMQTTEGERLYELMPLDFIGSGLVTVYNNLSSVGGSLLDTILKVGVDEFRSKMENPQGLAGLKKNEKFAAGLFPTVGNVIMNLEDKKKRKELSDAVMNMVILHVVLVKVILETDVSEDNFWDLKKVEKYLDRMAEEGIIPFEGAGAIYTMIKAGAKYRTSLYHALDAMRKQMEARFKYTP